MYREKEKNYEKDRFLFLHYLSNKKLVEKEKLCHGLWRRNDSQTRWAREDEKEERDCKLINP